MNLIMNAGEAIGDAGGVITVTTGIAALDAPYLARLDPVTSPAPGDYVYLEIADTGVGMDADTITKIFEPFFSTKFQGRGLGLAAVQGIVRGHNGALDIQSEPGHGTTFTVWLPATKRVASERDRGDAPERDSWRGTGTVLVVDDEEQVREYAMNILTRLGFTVLTAADGRAAVDLFRARADEITLVLLDMTMPRLNGTETFDAMQRIRPNVPVILCSGYNAQEAINRFSGAGLAGFVQKPYRVQTLTAALRTVLKT